MEREIVNPEIALAVNIAKTSLKFAGSDSMFGQQNDTHNVYCKEVENSTPAMVLVHDV